MNNILDYTKISSNYDNERYSSVPQLYIDNLRKKSFIKLLRPSTDMTILDVGCGTGSGSVFFSDLVYKIISLDGTLSMLNIALAKFNQFSIKNSHPINANAFHLPFKDESFDAVVSLNFIHLFRPNGIETQRKLLSEMARVTKINRSIIVEFDNSLYMPELGNKYSDFPYLSNELYLKEILGYSLPFTVRFYQLSKNIANFYSHFSNLWPFIFFSHRWIASFEKKRD